MSRNDVELTVTELRADLATARLRIEDCESRVFDVLIARAEEATDGR